MSRASGSATPTATASVGPDADAPIGIFDSGIGGLTVVRAIAAELPNENVIYVGDTARVPYGPKSPETVQRYSREIAAFLLSQGVKAIVIACNTATAHALRTLREELSLPIVGVVGPGARAAVAASRTTRIGVIGTTGTINSAAYERAIRRLAPHAVVVSQPCPLFVPLAEEGWTDHAVTRLVATEYLEPLRHADVDAVVLGCTHYPLLRDTIQQVLTGVVLIDSAEQTALEVRAVLAHDGLLRSTDSPPTHRFFATDASAQMLTLARRFLGTPIEHVETLPLA